MPAPSNPYAGLRYWRMLSGSKLRIRNFSGGLNLRDAAQELKPTESPDLWNVTLDERGSVAKRLGYSKYNSSPFTTALVSNGFYWQTGGNRVWQAGTKLYVDTSTTAIHTFTTSERVGFADFADKLWIIHPTDGLFQSDGTSGGTSVVSGGPKGSTLEPWQGRLFAAGDPAAKTRLYASALGDATNWTTSGTPPPAWFNDIREGNDYPIINIAAASGIDIAGRPGLLVFKRDPNSFKGSTHRVNDSTDGAYTTIDVEVGAASALSVVNCYGRSIVLSPRGIFWTDGVGPLQQASAQIAPLFDPTALAVSELDKWAAGVLGDRCYFSLTTSGKTANNLALEYHPLEGWIVQGSNAMSCYATDAEHLWGGSPTVNGQAYTLLSGGADDGADIASYFQTAWFEPAGAFLCRLRKLVPLGRGAFTLDTRHDYAIAQGVVDTLSISDTSVQWNDGTDWNQDGAVWGPSTFEAYGDPIMSLGTAHSVSFRISETSSLTLTAPALHGSSTSRTVGAWALSGLDLLYLQLGLAT